MVAASSDMKEFTLRALVIGLFMWRDTRAANAYLGFESRHDHRPRPTRRPSSAWRSCALMKGTLLEENFRANGRLDRRVRRRRSGLHDPGVRHPAHMEFHARYDAPGVPDGGGVDDPGRGPGDPVCDDTPARDGGRPGTPFPGVGRRIGIHKRDSGVPMPQSSFSRRWASARAHQAAGRARRPSGHRSRFPGRRGAAEGIVCQAGPEGRCRKSCGGRDHDDLRPAATPAYIGVGYIIGPELGALNFAGGFLPGGFLCPSSCSSSGRS